MKAKPNSRDGAIAQRAREAMLKRSRKEGNSMTEYYIVIGAFIAICVAAVIYVLLNPKKSFSQMQVIDESSILVHNGQQSSQFQQGANEFFQNWTLSDAKSLFQNSLSDTPNISQCKSKDDEEVIIPEKYDWREQYPDCVQEVQNTGNCSSSYAMSVLSVVSDRICQQSKVAKKVRLAVQELVDCDKNSYGCGGGYVNRVLNWGKRKGFIPEACYPYQTKMGECSEDHLETNECRQNNTFYRIIDYCIASDETSIKKEILKNGPTIAQMVIYTDFLTYKNGLYHRTEDAFKFNGQHIVKIIGWDKSQEGQDHWIIENVWGPDWGEKGYARILQQDKSTMLDYYALGLAVYPMTMGEYYLMQESLHQQQQQTPTEEDDNIVPPAHEEPVEEVVME